MQWVEVTGRTVEEAKESALDQLGVDEQDAEFEILEEPKSGLFGPVEERRFSFVQELDADGLVERIASISYVAAAPPADQANVERQLRQLVAAHGGRIAFPYVADVYVSRAA